MREKTKRAVSGLMAVAAVGGLTVGIADAAKSNRHGAKKSHKATGRHHGPGQGRPPFRHGPPGATALTGDDADKAKAAALEAVPGGTVRRSFKVDGDRDPGVTYVVEVAKTDGTETHVLLDADFKLVRTVDRPAGGGPCPGGMHGGPPPGMRGTAGPPPAPPQDTTSF